ncbi:MAG: ATP-binding protein [Methanomassiliicoccaceae archaeon]|nr:ATP-binding protein [Methanomassiliicoccaceae archaeon]MCL2317948.1 ATP-binding protein [Methanomassiliicoccaceae archaeon]
MEILNNRYKSGKFEFLTIYGRRRVGKTELITEFIKDKNSIFFPAIEANARDNLKLLTAAIYDYAVSNKKTAPDIGRIESFQEAFDTIAELAAQEKFVFVIDEFPFAVKSDPSIMSRLQHLIDHKLKKTDIMMIFSGSSMSFMEKQVHGYKSPLYGRRTGQIKLLPFRYDEIEKWFPTYTPEELALTFGVIGGVPSYLGQFSGKVSVKQNILNEIMKKDAMLFEETTNLMKQELSEPKTYNSIIAAIAQGRTKLSEISTAVGVETGPLTTYIDNLISLGIIKKERPILSDVSKKTLYLIADNYFRFWYRFVLKNTVTILSGKMPEEYDSAVGQHLSEYMGLAFEEMCKEFLLYRDEKLPFNVSQIGQWWGGDPISKSQVQIDIVALSSDSDKVIFGSCKYRSEKTSVSDLNELKASAEAMGGTFKKVYYYIFSKSGFSPSLIKAAEKDDSVRLIPLNELYGRSRS